MVSFDGKYITSYLMRIVTLAMYVNIYEIFTYEINSQTVDLENVVKEKKKNGTFTIPLEMFDSALFNYSEFSHQAT